MPIVSGDILRVAARMKVDGVFDVVNVLHFRMEAVSPDGDTQTLLDVAEKLSNCYALLATVLPTALSADALDVFNVSDDAPLGAHAWGAGFTGGTNGGDFTPLGVSALCLMNTATKRVQGRIYVGPLIEAAWTDGKVNSGSLPALQNYMAELRDTNPLSEGSEIIYGVYSRDSNILRSVTSQRVQLEAAYQRRRKRGRGS